MAKWISAKQFIEQTKGKSYDMDGYYGPQCWDYGDFFWTHQVGRMLSTGGSGSARGCWTIPSARRANAGKEFELITDKNKIKYGDWIVLNTGEFGHIGIVTAMNFSRGTVDIQSQNQGLIRNKVTTVRFNLSSFLGAFRYKAFWKTPTQAQQKKNNEEIALEVIRGKWGNGAERKKRLTAAGFDYNTIQAIVNRMLA